MWCSFNLALEKERQEDGEFKVISSALGKQLDCEQRTWLWLSDTLVKVRHNGQLEQ